MLKALRHKKTAKRIFIFLAIIIVPAFVLWGSGSMVRDKMRSTYAGEIFGQKISFQDYRDALKAVQDEAIIQFGDNFNQIKQFMDLEKLAWERLIILHETKKEKIKVSDEEVIETIAQYPFFQKDGKFNASIYEQILRYGLEVTTKDFERHVRESSEINKLFQRQIKNLKLSDAEILSEFKKENEKVKVNFIAFKIQDFLNEVLVSEEETKVYFDNNKNKFLTEPSINIEYAGVDFSDKTPKEEKEKTRTSMLLSLEAAKKEKDWQFLSQKNNLRHKITGFFYINEPIPGMGWSTQVLEVILPLKLKEVSPLIETEHGIFVARLLEIKEPQIPEFSQIKEKVIDKIKDEKAKDLAQAKAKSVKKMLEERLTSSNADFEKIAKELNLETKESDFFKQNQYLETIGISAEFTNAAFSLINKPQGLAVVNTPQASYVIKLLQFIPVDLKKFESEKGKFEETLKNKKSEQSLINFLEKLKNQACLKNNLAQSKKLVQEY